jgi:hypothetical protein
MAYTQKSSLSSDQVAFEQLAYFAYRSNPLHDSYASVKATRQSHRGSGVTFNIYADLSQATSALTETSDVTAVAMSDSTVTVSLVEYIETPRALLVTDGGSSTTDVYGTVLIGQQALAKAYSTTYGENPSVVFGPVTDSLRRFQPVGWYSMCGYGRFREAAIRRIESASSIGSN